jgi:glycosyltransferase involved in cell wall biosynthesis
MTIAEHDEGSDKESPAAATTAAAAKAAIEFIKKGNEARGAKDWDEARANYEEALRLDPARQGIWIQLGHAAKEGADYISAESAYRKAIELSPKDADAHLQLGHLLKISGRLPAALEAYTKAAALDFKLADAHSEIASLKLRVKNEGDTRAFDLSTPRGPVGLTQWRATKQRKLPEGSLAVVFDISDLMSYFHNLRLPTGIQRVQMEVIKSVLDAGATDFNYNIVCFTQEADFWIEIPPDLFYRFCQASVISGDVSAPEWVNLLNSLDGVLKAGKYFRFPKGAMLIDLGSSWWLQNYFLNLRLAKSLYDIKYVPFMHDLIPVMTPEYCTPELRRDFLSWITGAFDHADHFLTNSNATLNDLKTVASSLGHKQPDASVVRLDADFRRTLDTDAAREVTEDADRFLEQHDLTKNGYVLFVATIEARKNHITAFSAWLKLIKKRGIKNVPKLVCVGNEGWLMNAAYATLRASELLTSHVVILHRISDPALATLYENCICTLYPSSYEGWGLPVTEALCYGKVPIISNVSSLPEAGGEFGEYFDIGSEKELIAAVEKLVYDDKYREKREAHIKSKFQARTWGDIGKQVVGHLNSWHESDKKAAPKAEKPKYPQGIWPVPAKTGVLNTLGNISDAILRAGMKSGEIYRNGRGWWWPEPWGCWIKGTGPATVAFVLDGVANAPVLVYVGLKGVISKETTCTIKCEGVRTMEIMLPENKEQVVSLELPPTPDKERLVTFHVSCSTSVDFASLTKNVDKRVSGAGVRWFYACRKDDLLARVAMVEALSLGDFRSLMPEAPSKVDFFLHT